MGNKSVFGRMPENHPLRRKIRERDARPEPRLSFKQRDPKAWAREELLKMFGEARERHKKKLDG